MIGELLANEARRTGKAVDNILIKEAKESAAAKEAAKGPRKRARAQADEAARDKALTAIEEDLEAQLSRRLRAPPTISLQLPPRNSTLAKSEPKVVKPEAAAAKAADKLARLRTAVARAEAAVLPAEAHHTAAQRRLERARAALAQLRSGRFDHTLAGVWVPLPDQSAERDERFEAHVSEYVELDGEMEALEARVSRLHSECNAALGMLLRTHAILPKALPQKRSARGHLASAGSSSSDAIAIEG